MFHTRIRNLPAMRPTKANPYCAVCIKAHNALNGRYCTALRRYVEYAKQPPCNNK